MIFNSIDFAIFFPFVFFTYWFLLNHNLKLQNAFIVVASYIFYGMWDWRFLFLILLSTIVDFTVGIGLSTSFKQQKRKIWLWISIFVNLGLLGFFKYANFFIESFTQTFSLFGVKLAGSSLNIILPVGISFYTFQTLSYSIEVYKKKIEPTRDFIAFASFVSFFPQLVAGPIERATHLLPQFYRKRTFDYNQAVNGLRQILWGLFKKMVIADNCATIANQIFNHSDGYNGSTLLLGVFFFSFQIYGDFSGYSDIAIGCSRLLGFDLMQNFATPYFSRDIAEFWRRWHISLSTWFRDYLYIPLGGSRGGTWNTIRNIFIIFFVSGFWHGANWTFIVWGLIHALFFLPLLLVKKNRTHLDVVAKGRLLPTMNECFGMLSTYALSLFAWIFFRAENLSHAGNIITEIFSPSLFSFPQLPNLIHVIATVATLLFFVSLEWLGREQRFALERLGFSWPTWFRLSFYASLCITIFLLAGQQQAFIYFQF